MQTIIFGPDMKQIPNDIFFNWIENEISNGNSVQIRVKGNSMFPLLRNGNDIVILSPCNTSKLKPMDTILFRYKGKHLMHRIYRINGNTIYLRGDGAFEAKETCKFTDVVGKVESIIRPDGRTISADSWKWKIPSCLWNSIGVVRKPVLYILHKLYL